MGKKNEENAIVLRSIRDGYNLTDAYFKEDVGRARIKEEIYTVLNLEQLTGTRIRDFYVETDKVRGDNTIASLEKLLNDPLSPYTKRLFSGFFGSGKTTELVKLYSKMLQKFNTIIFSVANRARPDEITIESLLFLILGDVLNYLGENNLVDEKDELLKEIKKNITKWCSEVWIISEEEEGTSDSIGVGFEFLKGLFFSAKTESRSSKADRKKISRLEEHKIYDLIFECNRIFDYLEEKTGKETLIIIDDLEKVPFTAARDFYIRNAAFIRDFRCKMVMTIPVELIYHTDFAIIQGIFGNAEVLPMIKVKDIEGMPYKPGIDCLIKILDRRLDLSLFEDECYMDAVKYSGGAIRELFRIVQRAALIEETGKITVASMQKSINYYMNDLASKIYERRDEIIITFQEYLEVLFDIYGNNKRNPEQTLALLDLLRIRAVMRFNGEGFYDTHPLLDGFIERHKQKQQNKPKNEQKKRGE